MEVCNPQFVLSYHDSSINTLHLIRYGSILFYHSEVSQINNQSNVDCLRLYSQFTVIFNTILGNIPLECIDKTQNNFIKYSSINKLSNLYNIWKLFIQGVTAFLLGFSLYIKEKKLILKFN